MEQTIDIGAVIIIDGLAWTVTAVGDKNLAYARNEEYNKGIWFARSEATVLGAGLWGLPGRIEPGPKDATVVAQPASADLSVEG